MKARDIKCVVEPLSGKYADGLERVELYVLRESLPLDSTPKRGKREAITFSTPAGRSYEGGLRTYEGRWPYVCPDLYHGKTKLSLARLLKDSGIRARQTVSIKVTGSNWELIGGE